MIKAILFDWGGVLSPSNNVVAAKKLSKKYSCDEERLYHDLDSLENKYSTGSECGEYYEIISRKYNIPSEEIKDALNRVPAWKFFGEIKALKSSYVLVLLSNQMKLKTNAIRESNDLGFFNYIFFSNEIGLIKPNRDIFEFVLDKIGIKAKSCLFIDDTQRNIETASKLGIKTILFKNPEQVKKEMESYGILFL